MLGLGKVGIASQADVPKARLAAQLDGAVEIPGGLLMAGPVATPVDYEQRFARVGQGKHQGMIAPLPLVVDVHAFLALSGRLHHRAVTLDHRLVEEGAGLLRPDLPADAVEDGLQTEDSNLVEAAAEVAGGGGIGNATRPQGVQVGTVATKQLQVFQASPPGQQVVGDIEYMVAVVIGQMDLQQAEMRINHLGQTETAGQQVHRTNSTMGSRPGAIGNFVMNVRCRHDGLVTTTIVALV